MTVATAHYCHGILFPGAQFVSQLTDATPSAETEELVGYASGHPDPLFLAIRGQKPRVSFRTPQIKTVLDLAGVNGCSLAASTDLFFKKGTDLGVREASASTVHQRFRMAEGFLSWSQISAGHQQDAELTGQIIPTWDGTNAPLVPAGSLALSGTSTAAEWYTLGPVKINGTLLPGVGNVTFDKGIKLLEASADGDIWTSFVGVQSLQPVLTISGIEIAPWASYGLAGGVVSAVTWYLRKKAADGGNVADGTAQHISITATNGLILPQDTKGSGNNPAETSVKIAFRPASAAASSFAISTTVAIS